MKVGDRVRVRQHQRPPDDERKRALSALVPPTVVGIVIAETMLPTARGGAPYLVRFSDIKIRASADQVQLRGAMELWLWPDEVDELIPVLPAVPGL